MKKQLIILWFVIGIISCQEKNQTIFLHALHTEKVEKLNLKIDKKGEFTSYNYVHQKDTLNNIDLKYYTKEDVLMIEKDTFLVTKKKYVTKNYDYKMYQKNEMNTPLRTLVFDKKYGLLCSTGFGADFLFFKDSLPLPETKLIFKQIILELNKIDK
ncbi:hypothetical protein [Polaribacter sp. R77954]|uniref:hypothetical protein n=1 Tax=Polaribacter sp. R77954 TaxID=3093870 RepID=UPI0037CA3C67